LRTPELLAEVAGSHPELVFAEAGSRRAVQAALSARPADVSDALEAEEQEERRKDREYWVPLKQELKNSWKTAQHALANLADQ
jgi:acyl-CoA thioesterase